MTNFQSARDAKEFLIARVVEEAKGENIPLSEVEHKMLYFSETHWTIPDIASVSERFDREYDQDEYEEHYILVMIDRAGLRPRRRIQGSKEQPESVRSIASLMGRYEPIFLVVFLLCFLWLHFIGPRRLAGNWETHEPLSSLGSAIVSALIALTLTAFVMRRVG